MPEYKRMIQRHGTYSELEQSEALPYEFLAVDSGDPNTEDGKALYYQASGEVRKRIKTADEGLPANSVDTSQLVNRAVTSEKIGTGEVKAINIDSEAVTSAKIKSGAVNNSHLANNSVMSANIKDGEVKTNDIDDRAVTSLKIGIGAVQSDNIGVGQVQESNIDGGAVTNSKLDKDSVSTVKIQDGAVTLDKLGTDAQTVINNKLPYQRLVKNTGGVPTALQVEDLNSLNLDHNTFYYIWLAYGFLYPTQPREWAVILELESGNQLIITKNGDIYSREKVSGVWSDFINPLANLLKTTDYSIGFNTEGMAVKKTTWTIMGAGTFLSGIKSIYLSEKVTTLQDGFFNTASDLTDLYVDSDSVEMPTVPARVTVHNKGTFKVSDLLVTSMVASNTKLLNLENTFSGLINGDEVAY